MCTSSTCTFCFIAKFALAFFFLTIVYACHWLLISIFDVQSKIKICKYRELGTCCMEGCVTFDWAVDRSGFIAGEDLWIQGSAQNDSKQTIIYSMVSLFKV